MQEVDAERRIQVLRGLRPDDAPPSSSTVNERETHGHDAPRRDRKRRRIAGEDDTARDIRYAQEASAAMPAKSDLQLKAPKTSDAPLTDSKGHINLFPVEGTSRHNAPKNAEAEAESAKRKKEFEDQYTMRFSNAAGFKQAVGQKPWYHSMGTEIEEALSKDVWGNEDPRRKEREKMRITADDPLAIIQKGVKELREVERERNKWKGEKAREIKELVELERQRNRKMGRHEDQALEDFSLDASPKDKHYRHRRDGSKERHLRRRHRDRSRSPARSKHHSHRHHHHHHASKSGEISSKEHSERHNHRHHRSNENKERSAQDQEVSIEMLRQKRDNCAKIEHTRATALFPRPNTDTRPGWEPKPGGRYSMQFATA